MILNHCYQGDCREVMKTWPTGFADACITDPPYGDTGLVWDRRCIGWIEEVARVLKPNSSIWVFGSMRFIASIWKDMEDAGFKYAQDIVWQKQNGSSLLNDRFRRIHEHAVHFYRGNWADVYKDPQYILDSRRKTVRRNQSPAHWGKINPGLYVSADGGQRLERSVIEVKNEHGNAIHPTQKPLGIIAPLIRYSVPKAGIVIDPFAGSGSVGVTAGLLERQFVACEINIEYLAGQHNRGKQQNLELREALA
jgi:site-specific DNA-methyltransferase (adenine-specific)